MHFVATGRHRSARNVSARVVLILVGSLVQFTIGCGNGSETLSLEGTVTAVDDDRDTLPSTVVEESEAYDGYRIVGAQLEEDATTWEFKLTSERSKLTDRLTFQWTFGEDPETYTGTDQAYTFSVPGEYLVTVTALTRQGTVAFVLTLQIEIPVLNEPPVADAGDDQVVDENALVFLYGGGSIDPDDDDLAYTWAQTSGPPVNLLHTNEATARFIAPLVEEDTEITFALTVSDGELTDQAEATVLVLNMIDMASGGPTADAGPDQVVPEFELVTLDGSNSSGSESAELIFEWFQVSGPMVTLSNAGEAVATFEAPGVGGEVTVLLFELVVMEGDLVASDDVTITVMPNDSGDDGGSGGGAPPPPLCQSDGDCDDNAFCNGVETCVDGSCQAGTPIVCDDGVDCTIDSCNEATDSCENLPDDGLCDNGLYCNGAETCDPVLGCQAGAPVNCDDGVACTDDSCNETTDSCDNVPNDGVCDNGLFCDGTETCDSVLGCQVGTPITCGDGVACTIDSCNEATDSCDHVPSDGLCDNGLYCDGSETCDPVLGCLAGSPVNCDDGIACTEDSCNELTESCDNIALDSLCDNGLFCDGAETCDVLLGCQAGSDPCPAQLCDEDTDTCVDLVCALDEDCDDGLWCNGAETCVDNICQAGAPVDCDDGVACTVDSCNEAAHSCQSVPTDSLCDNGLFCDGVETCDNVLGCQAGAAVDCDDGVACTVDSCDEGTDSCDNVPDNNLCEDGQFCNGTEICDPVLGCQAGNPVDCGDGVACTVDSCNEATDSCENVSNDSLCDNGLFCDGSETCDPVLGCQAGANPCPGQLCNETDDTCVDCLSDDDCDDGQFCNGAETCVDGSCAVGTDPCPGAGCDEVSDVCVEPPTLCVSPTELDLGCSAISLAFEVWNCGGELLDYTIVDDADWLTVLPSSGDSSGEHDVVTATVDRTGLADGTYEGEITVTPNVGSAISIAVLMLVQPQCDPLTPIARWDVVPYQRINQGETFKCGVVAFSKPGIQKATFTISGQGYSGPASIDVTEMTYNDRTDVHEYWVPIAASSFTSDGPITVEATVYGNDGGIRDKNTGGGGLGLDPLVLHVNPQGTLPQPEAWVDVNGDDDTGQVNNPSLPFLSIVKAIESIRSWRNTNGYGYNADGGIVRLNSGTHITTSAYTDIAVANEWVTVTTSSGGTRANTILTAGGAIHNVGLVAFKGITLNKLGGYIISPSSAFPMRVWIDDCDVIGKGRWFRNSHPVSGNVDHMYCTDSFITEIAIAMGTVDNVPLARGLTIEAIGNDVFVNRSMIVNVMADDVDPDISDIPEIVGATYYSSGHPSGYDYVIEKSGAFENLEMPPAGTTWYFQRNGSNNDTEPIAGKVDNDAIWLSSGFSGDVTDGSIGTRAHADAFQLWGGVTNNHDNIIVYNYRATNLHYQGLFARGRGGGAENENPPDLQGAAFVNVYFQLTDDASPGQNAWARRGNHVLWWHCSFINATFYLLADGFPETPDWPVQLSNLSAVGNMFYRMQLNHDDSGIDWSGTDNNHFEITDGHNTITRGTNITAGDPQLDASGRPEVSSPLVNRIAPLLVPVDAGGTLRDSMADVGPFEN